MLPYVVNFRLCLTHFPLVTHIWVSESGQHWFRQWLVAYSAPSHYLNQCWFIVNWTFTNKLYWCFNQNTKLYIHKNASQNIVCEKAAILSRGKWVNSFSTASAVLNQIIIKSPQYTGGDFMFLYRFVRRRRRRLRRRPQILVHAITFEQLFGFLSFLAQIVGPDL